MSIFNAAEVARTTASDQKTSKIVGSKQQVLNVSSPSYAGVLFPPGLIARTIEERKAVHLCLRFPHFRDVLQPQIKTDSFIRKFHRYQCA